MGSYIQSEASTTFVDEVEEAEAIREKRIRWVADLLNGIVKDEGVEALKENGWVEALVHNAKKLGINNASEELLVERFQNEGSIHMDRDLKRMQRNDSLVNQIMSMGRGLGNDMNASQGTA